MAITKKPTVKKRTTRSKPSITETATNAIKMPISFKEFAKKPVAGIAFICITGIGYLYIDVKKTFTENSIVQKQRIDKLEYRDSVKTSILMKADSSLSASNMRLSVLESLGKIEKQLK